MSFQAPVFLLGLLVIPLALAALWFARRRPQRYAIRYPSLPTLARVNPKTSLLRRVLPTGLLCLALAGLALALARPEATGAGPVERASVVLVGDTSGSMAATDVEPSRLDAAKAAAERFLDRVPDELRVGLVGFSDTPHTVLRPTEDHDAVRVAVKGLGADGGTASGDALQSALQALGERGEEAPPAAIVLLSDGAHQTGADPVEVARTATDVPIYTVSLGTDSGTVQVGERTLRVPPDRETLAAVAQATGGDTFTAQDADALDAVYERLGSQIGTKKEEREISAGFAAVGLLLLGGSLASSHRWRGRLP